MAENRDDLLEHYRQMRDDLLDAIAGLTDAQMTEPTIDGWSVADHLLHLALWDEIRATEVERISAGFQTAWRISGAQDETLNAIAHEARGSLSLAQARWELDGSRQRLLDVIAAATDAGLDTSRYGEAALRSTHEAQHTGWIRRWRGERGY